MMNFDVKLELFPIIHDIPAQKLWIPPALALGAYIFPRMMGKIFPLHTDHRPLAKWRNQIAKVHHDYIKIKNPEFYRFIHVDLKDNLPIILFCLSLWVLKKENQPFQSEKLFLVTTLFVGCLAATLIRRATKEGLLKLSQELERRTIR
jgi:hypothetical protein